MIIYTFPLYLLLLAIGQLPPKSKANLWKCLFLFNFVVLAFTKYGSSLFLGLKEPLRRGLAYEKDKGLYLGVNILLAVLCIIPICLWMTFIGSVVRFQELDETILGLAHAVNLLCPYATAAQTMLMMVLGHRFVL